MEPPEDCTYATCPAGENTHIEANARSASMSVGGVLVSRYLFAPVPLKPGFPCGCLGGKTPWAWLKAEQRGKPPISEALF